MMEEYEWSGWRSKRVKRIRECPACGDPINENVAAHIAKHDPEDFGLSPMGSSKPPDRTGTGKSD